MPQAISLIDVVPLLPQLEASQLIVTPNQRLASRIVTAYGLHQQQQGKAVVAAPRVLSMGHWLEQCWRQLLLQASPLAANKICLSQDQQRLLWQQVIVESELGMGLLRPAATASQVAVAYNQLLQWCIESTDSRYREEFSATEDSRALLGWIEDFEKRCQRLGYLAEVRCHGLILQAFQQQQLPTEGEIYAVGFESIAPLQAKILSKAGQFQAVADKGVEAAVQTVACETSQQEFYAAAVWAKQQLRERPDSTVAIVVPELGQQRQLLQRVLQEVFEPEYMQPDALRRAVPFNFSAGYSLLDTPLVAAAMDCLSLSAHAIESERVIALLQSPFCWSGDIEQESFDRLALALTDLRQFTLGHADLRYWAEKSAAEQAEPLAQQLQQQGNCIRGHNLRQPRCVSAWQAVFNDLLAVFAWSKRRSLDSLEYQQLQQWQQALERFAGLDELLGELSYSEALSHWRGMLASQVFQPQTPESRLQVLGVLEAAGLQFDALWLSSMSEQQWPAVASPNPFIPINLQRRFDMPHASAGRELEYARHLSQRFLRSAKQVVVSYPQFNDDCEMLISPLFADYPLADLLTLLQRPLDQLLPLHELRRRHLESSQLESFEPGAAPRLSSDESVRGGSSIFASQSACPFRAFAGHRLRLRSLAEPELGLNAADRGSLLHRALELLWRQLQHQQALLALDSAAEQALIIEAVSHVLTEFQRYQPKRLGERMKRLEQQRLLRVLQAWLQIERERAAFSIEDLEQEQVMRFAELEIRLRLDRVDRLDDGRRLLVDYKSGQSSVSRWWGERPEEPQLPLYSTLLPQQSVGGIAYAQVRIDGCALKGVGAEDLTESQLQWRDKQHRASGAEDWPQLLEQWQRVLSALANDFINGEAAVDPNKPPQTCQYCDLATLCRVNCQPVVDQQGESR